MASSDPLRLLGQETPGTSKRKADAQMTTIERSKKLKRNTHALTSTAKHLFTLFESEDFIAYESELLDQLKETLARLSTTVKKKCLLQAHFAVIKKEINKPDLPSIMFYTNEKQYYHSSGEDKKATRKNPVFRKGLGKGGVVGPCGEKKPSPRQHHHAERAFLSHTNDLTFWDEIPKNITKELLKGHDNVLIIYLANKWSSCPKCTSCLGLGDSQARICDDIQKKLNFWIEQQATHAVNTTLPHWRPTSRWMIEEYSIFIVRQNTWIQKRQVKSDSLRTSCQKKVNSFFKKQTL